MVKSAYICMILNSIIILFLFIIRTIYMQIAVYFGSFNPFHLGHLRLAEQVLSMQLVDELWFVVSPQNPLKDSQDYVPAAIKLEILQLSIKEYPAMKASAIEFQMPIPSYTIDSLQLLTELYPQHQFSLLIGSDNAVIFHQWKNYQQILDNYPVFVYPRRGYDFQSVAQQYPQMQLLHTPYYDISSTEIRNAIKQGKDIAAFVHPAVKEYIVENGLYG